MILFGFILEESFELENLAAFIENYMKKLSACLLS